ncbi:MAG: hypothetical protein AAGA48_34100 [Myxococcota bacterium]
MRRSLPFAVLLLAATACSGPEPLPTITGQTAETGTPPDPTAATGDTGPVFEFDVEKESFAAFRADKGVTLGSNDEVTAWTDVSGTLTATLDPPGTDGIKIFVDGGLPGLDFNGTSNLVAELGQRLSDATIFVRFRYDATQSDNDYLYTVGDGLIDTAGGTQMSLSRGTFDGQGTLESYHYTGKDELLGERIRSDRWITSTQIYRGTKQKDGGSHHTLFLDGDDAKMDLADTAYDVQGSLAIGNYLSGDFRLANAEIRRFVIFDRILTDDEITATEAWMAAGN